MSKKSIISIGAVSAVILLSAMLSSGLESVFQSVFPEKTRPTAVFDHEFHSEGGIIDECNVCHHVYENGVKSEDESSEDMSCAECHHPENDGDAPHLRKAFHLSCKGCHLSRKAGPIFCGECHRKQKTISQK